MMTLINRREDSEMFTGPGGFMLTGGEDLASKVTSGSHIRRNSNLGEQSH